MSKSFKYDHIDFKPPGEVARNAEKGLDLRRRFDRGGTEIGVARARSEKPPVAVPRHD